MDEEDIELLLKVVRDLKMRELFEEPCCWEDGDYEDVVGARSN